MRRIKLTIAALFVVSPFAANADPILGTYEGTWTQGSGGGTMTFVVETQTENGGGHDISGYFDWICDSVIICFGRELWTGTLSTIGILDLAGDSLVASDLGLFNLALGTYDGAISNGTVNGTFGFKDFPNFNCVNCTWSATAVPEPGTLALLGMGLFGMGLARRRIAV